MIRAIIEATAGALLILGVAASFLFSEPLTHRVEAGERICGVASYYGQESGNRTATGDYFDGSSLTMAMPSGKHLGERWRVTFVGTAKHPGTGKSIDLLVNDKGPKLSLHRVADLSVKAAETIGIKIVGKRGGLGFVCMERL